ncbi:hypothetical protein V8F20_011853 [Naviculisporaceae sp. PSN 640]
MAEASISTAVKRCLGLFELLLSPNAPTSGKSPKKAILVSLQDEEARFKVWVGNIGAHKTGRSSLQYRLRDASHIQKQVMVLIFDLASYLERARAIISGKKTPWDEVEDDEDSILSESDSEPDTIDEDFPNTELDQIVLVVADVINCLLRLSVAIKNPAPHDRFTASIPGIDSDHYEQFDIQHVQEKFGHIDEGLAVRLGKAITRRRQYFKYRERHHQKLSEGISAQGVAPSNIPKDTVSTIASSIPKEAKYATFDLSRLATTDEDAFSDSGASVTTFASSIAGSDTVQIPPMPREANKGPFECPFCFMIITASTTISWRRHVFSDLRPYVCLFEQCPEANREFTRRRDWTAHESQNHWKKYLCPAGCNKEFTSVSQCQEHLGEAHPDSIPPDHVDAMINLSARPLVAEDGIRCPLCRKQLLSFKKYWRHVGTHQKQLALFALPKLDTTKEGDSDEENDDRSKDGEFSSDETDISDELAAPEDPGPEDEIAGASSGSTALNEEVISDLVDDDDSIRIYGRPEGTEGGVSREETETRFLTKCFKDSCERRRCTYQDPEDPKDSAFCREHVCSVAGCVRSRTITVDPSYATASKRLETECSLHWANSGGSRRRMSNKGIVIIRPKPKPESSG